jgi:hypothetical protein
MRAIEQTQSWSVAVWVRAFLVVLCLLGVGAARASAEDVGSIAAMDGSVELGRNEAWVSAQVGTAVQLGDTIRTGRPGRARIVFRDDTVLNVGTSSRVVVDEQVFDPDTGTFAAAFRVLQGKVRTLVSQYYMEPRAKLRVETPTSVSGVRGTEFIVVYDPERDVTEVVGITREVTVESVLIPVGRAVIVKPRDISIVARGKYPTEPRQLEEDVFRQYLDGLEFIGAGEMESMLINNPIIAGAVAPPPDRIDPVTQSVNDPPAREPVAIGKIGGPAGGVPGDSSPVPVPDVGSVIQQPPAAVDGSSGGSGNVGIPF